MENKSYVTPIGQVAVFYLPIEKLEYPEDAYNLRWGKIAQYFKNNHFGYTVQKGYIEGHWMIDCENRDFLSEENIRFEVSFSVEQTGIFLDFISDLCEELEEEAIYLTMGSHSYLVRKKESNV